MKRTPYNPDTLSGIEVGALALVEGLRCHGFEAYFVGGCVRDRLIGRAPKDVDIATNALPGQIMAIFPNTHPVGAAFGVILVKHDEVSYEIATFREDMDYKDGRRPESVRFCTAAEDAKRRDFTINALFWDPVTREIHDFCDGLADLERGIIRAIGEPEKRFAEDYLRMLRAVRFASRYRFDLEAQTAAAITTFSPRIKDISSERIFIELTGILTGPSPARGVQMLQDLGLLHELLPEVEAFIGVEQPKQYHPEGDVWVHTLLMLERMVSPTPEIAWSVLLHDLGKPPTFELDDANIERFPCHAKVGAAMAADLLGRLRCSKKFIDHVTTAVYYHMAWGDLHLMRQSKVRRLLARDSLATELELHRVDCMSSHRLTGNYTLLLDKIQEFANEPVMPKPLINGRDLMALGFAPGPRMGDCLKAVQEKQLNDELTSHNDALAWVRETWIDGNE